MGSDEGGKSFRLLDNDGMACVVKQLQLRARYRITQDFCARCRNDLVVNTM